MKWSWKLKLMIDGKWLVKSKRTKSKRREKWMKISVQKDKIAASAMMAAMSK